VWLLMRTMKPAVPTEELFESPSISITAAGNLSVFTATSPLLERRRRRRPAADPSARTDSSWANNLRTWLRLQSVNVSRHAAALRPFRRDEFGRDSAAPSESHIDAANDLLAKLRPRLMERTRHVSSAVHAASGALRPGGLQQVVARKQAAHQRVMGVERVWDFYFELFGQRQSQFGEWLLGCDRIALDCYQTAYLGLGKARTIPAPPPFSYMRTGFSPATYRRGIPLRQLGLNRNPFPLIQLPYHRLVNPWTLGAILHEVSHNLHNDLGLAQVIPQQIHRRILEAGLGSFVASVWRRWNRETFADLAGLLLGGPAVVGSLMDVVGRSARSTYGYSQRGPHPTPYLRTLLSVELLRRMGFPEEAERYCRSWTRIYPNPRSGTIPGRLLDTFDDAKSIVVDTVCFQPYDSLGNKPLAEVMRFAPKEQQMVEEAAQRLAAGNDPGVVPERFLIGGSRIAVERRLARPGVITENFYRELARR
jgi:hypothetical protein